MHIWTCPAIPSFSLIQNENIHVTTTLSNSGNPLAFVILAVVVEIIKFYRSVYIALKIIKYGQNWSVVAACTTTYIPPLEMGFYFERATPICLLLYGSLFLNFPFSRDHFYTKCFGLKLTMTMVL
jgi:hypothetical protein